jgi:hypothetical protein
MGKGHIGRARKSNIVVVYLISYIRPTLCERLNPNIVRSVFLI